MQTQTDRPTNIPTLAELSTEAEAKWRAARSLYDSLPMGSKAWRAAGDDLEFWGGKMTAYDILTKQEAAR